MLARSLFTRTGRFMNVNSRVNPFFRSMVMPKPQFRAFSTPTDVGITDMPDVFKVNYTEEFDQGLTDE